MSIYLHASIIVIFGAYSYTDLDVLRPAYSRCCGKSIIQTSSLSTWSV